jgi:hypothetical protein
MALNRQKIEQRLLSSVWHTPTGPMNLRSAEGRKRMPILQLREMINDGIKRWAIANGFEKTKHDFGNLTIDERFYTLPTSVLYADSANVGYDDTLNFPGYAVEVVRLPALFDTKLRDGTFEFSGLQAASYQYQDYTLAAPETDYPKTVTFASLGADVNSNTPPSVFNQAPMWLGTDPQVDRGVFVDQVTTSTFRINLSDNQGASGDLPFDINFSFAAVNQALETQVKPTSGIPANMLLWDNQFILDPVPSSTYAFRIWGFMLPTELTDDTTNIDVDAVLHPSIYQYCKMEIAEELQVTNMGHFERQLERARVEAFEFQDRKDGGAVCVRAEGNGYF